MMHLSIRKRKVIRKNVRHVLSRTATFDRIFALRFIYLLCTCNASYATANNKKRDNYFFKKKTFNSYMKAYLSTYLLSAAVGVLNDQQLKELQDAQAEETPGMSS